MFSPELIARTIEYFKNTYGNDISEEMAQYYLSSLADLFTSFMDLKKVEYSDTIGSV